MAVHGLQGDAYRTWEHDNGSLSLREFLLTDIPNARIMTFGYDSTIAFSRYWARIGDKHLIYSAISAPNGVLLRLALQQNRSCLYAIAWGVGGQGKTQIALKWYHRKRQLYSGTFIEKMQQQRTVLKGAFGIILGEIKKPMDVFLRIALALRILSNRFLPLIPSSSHQRLHPITNKQTDRSRKNLYDSNAGEWDADELLAEQSFSVIIMAQQH